MDVQHGPEADADKHLLPKVNLSSGGDDDYGRGNIQRIGTIYNLAGLKEIGNIIISVLKINLVTWSLKKCFQNFPPDPYITLYICKTENPGV